MKRYLILIICLVICSMVFAQVPQFFQYQSVVRDASGAALVNQSVSFQLSIISGTLPGTVEYIETHSATTNDFGIVTFAVGSGTPVTNLFSDIDWSISPHHLKVEIDLGSGFVDIGTTQLLSVPYALYSENAGNIPVYTGGLGINVTGTTITNTSPDQIVNLTQSGATTITGTYPNYEISSTDLNSGTPGGQNTSIQYNNSGVFAGDTASLTWDYNNNRLGVGISNPLGRVVIKGSNTASDTLPLFEVKNKLGQPVFIVYPDSVHFYIKDDASPSNRGGFAVSGRSNAKAGSNDYLKVRPDSTRIWTGDTLTGFGVRNIGATSKTSYMQLNIDNYYIGHEAGNSNITGLYNSFIGYQAGKDNTEGNNNIFIGYKSGKSNIRGNLNTFLGFQSGYNNNSDGCSASCGNYNTFIGSLSGYNNVSGGNNTFIGAYSGFNVIGGFNSVFIGERAGFSTVSGSANTYIGYLSGENNTGSSNTFTGYECGHSITTSNNCSYYGSLAGSSGTGGLNNSYFGSQCGLFNASGISNSVFGKDAGLGSSGNAYDYNCYFGVESGRATTTGSYNSYFGVSSGRSTTTGDYNCAYGWESGYSMTTGYRNACFGFNSGSAITTGTFNTIIGHNANVSVGTSSNAIAIGNAAIANASNQVLLGNSSITSFYCMGAYVGGVGVTNRDVYVDNTGKIGFISSSKRYKKDVKDMENVNWLYDLRPVNYIYKNDTTNKKQFGLIAEEVEQINPLFVSYNNDGSIETVNYSSLITPLLKAVQEQKKQIEKLNSENTELKAQIEKIKKYQSNNK